MPEKQEQNPSLESELRRITLADFERVTDPAILEWAKPQEEMPEDFWAKFKDIPTDTHLFEVISHIDRELYDPERNHHGAKSFADSRFTSLAEMIERKMVSCGAKTKIFSEVLRRLSVPVQLVHLQPIADPHNPQHKHAWIRLYNPATREWLTVDPTQTRTRYAPEEGLYEELGTYHSWEELKKTWK
jgi:hypothetical protein